MTSAMLFGLGLNTGLWGAMIPGPLFLYTVSEAFWSGQMAGIALWLIGLGIWLPVASLRAP